MADIINLRQARKVKARKAAEAQAEENRIRFGRTKAQKAQDESEAARRVQTLEGARRDRPEDEG